MAQIYTQLLDVAAWKLQHEQEKLAFVPPEGDPAAGGAPPGDPAAAGGMPPGDPAAAGGGGGAPPPPQGDPLLQQLMQQVQQLTQMVQQGGGGGAAASPTGPAGVGQKMKIDPTMVYLQLGRLTKMLIHMFEQMQWPIPAEVLNDDAMIQQAAGQAPPAGAGGAAGGAPPAGGDPAAQQPQGLPAIGQSPAINPIAPPKTANSVFDLFYGTDLLDATSAAELLMSK